MSNPNPGLDPDDNTIKNHHLMYKYTLLKARLERAETPWHVVEQQTWEIQEYLGGRLKHCSSLCALRSACAAIRR